MRLINIIPFSNFSLQCQVYEIFPGVASVQQIIYKWEQRYHKPNIMTDAT